MRPAKRLAAAVLGTVLAMPLEAMVSVSQMGYHTGQQKRVIVYTDDIGGTFTVKDRAGNPVFSGPLERPTDASGQEVACQGGQPCLVGDFSPLRARGTFHVETGGERSPSFPVDRNVFGRHAWKFLEFFDALRQQGSSYHARLHAAEDPPFTIMGDGSFVMTTHMAAVTLARLASAYERNPALWRSDRRGSKKPDLVEMAMYDYYRYLAAMQDHNGDPDMPGGHLYDFACKPDYNPARERYNRHPDPCLIFDSSASMINAAEALAAYASVLPAFRATGMSSAYQSALKHALQTRQHIRSRYGVPSGNAAAAMGAALFKLSDMTGKQEYLREAHALRGSVPTQLSALETFWNESYWEEYARHKGAIEKAGLEYAHNGQAPERIFIGKIEGDWTGGKHPISGYGERVYILDDNIDFQYSRSMLIEGLIAAKAREHSGSRLLQTVADTQLQWLTGMNSVQDGDRAGPTVSRSFIFGIGNHGRHQHVRLVDPGFYGRGGTFLNGRRFIPGWVAGAFDSHNDPDKVLNYHDEWGNWRYTESTNEIVAAAMELFSYLDAQYNGRARLARR